MGLIKNFFIQKEKKEDNLDTLDIEIKGVRGRINVKEDGNKKKVTIKIGNDAVEMPKEYY